MLNIILIFSCRDRIGIVRTLSRFFSEEGANITAADQYSTDPEGGTFFIRMECSFAEDRTLAEVQERFAPVATELDAGWEMFEKEMPLRMGILVSRADHCLHELLYHWYSGDINVTIPFVISNHSIHKALAGHYGIPYYHIPATAEDRKEGDILRLVQGKTDFLVLARYMQILSAEFIRSYAHPIINIHHSFLPSFKGADPYRQAFDRGVKLIGATAHYVTTELDEGPIISQAVKAVTHRDNVDTLRQKGKMIEKDVLVDAVKLHLQHRIIQFKHKTIVFN